MSSTIVGAVADRSALCNKYSMARKKNPAAVQLGRRGGKAYVERHTPVQRSEAAKKAAQARWAKQKGKFSRDTET